MTESMCRIENMSVCLVSIYWSAILLCTEFTVSTLLLVVFCVFSDIYFLRFYLGFLYFVTIRILIQPLQYCVMARWLLFWLEDVTALLLLSTNHSQFCMLTNIKSLFSIGCCNMQNKIKLQPLKYLNFVFFPQQKQINTPDFDALETKYQHLARSKNRTHSKTV